ncbi:hypothetical protein B1B_00684 [mine drainage metagenome]|uniref:Uncharacterized protein n=1 Tax=mine drainage metagenome TaxID=410659 RepID=T1DAP4_9ZZZZ
MSIENVSITMREIFGIRISEGEVQNILSQLSVSLGDEYANLINTIREAPSRYMDTTSWRIDGENYNMWTFVTKGEVYRSGEMSGSAS